MVGLMPLEPLCAGDTVMDPQWLRTTKVLTVNASMTRSPIELATESLHADQAQMRRKRFPD
ncbi:hypothetical protein V7S43_011523 [Phytophthora oleae]|uniref:Uncharacterized protein n=1 Tax=Phytophthora oleae TaxID=2107226 RepID=A0ABD3FCI8_9STRA